MSELQEHIESCDCRLVSCPNDCGGKFLQRGIPNHLATRCPKKSSNTSAPVECKFCDDEIDASRIQDHEQNCDWKPKRCQHCNMVVISRDLMRHESSCKTNMKSCSHCNENMPQSALTTHAGRCSKRPIKCIRCCQLFPADAIVAHSTNCKVVLAPIKIPPPPPFPPPPSATTPTLTSQQNTRRVTADPWVTGPALSETTKARGTYSMRKLHA
ncbi:uncharacterized protein PITG_07254 [Phytophthora infestans T30-4]|uniref:TRAF-type domain-containing protein n=1 Tax=Phytophthora infestans (strain T30-4) TaxID=403677 RepID=D0N7M5_PHYIT|nr:uncharacterized protein PITG_07254 [Phytophthora infestans T30-4]EEY53574.1 conserved hypothetical protein [Phytophthora infestans T30-4]|eukprot:XP_002905192.1 conserved hypothetical protein [Phytophthora infestans T30-4]